MEHFGSPFVDAATRDNDDMIQIRWQWVRRSEICDSLPKLVAIYITFHPLYAASLCCCSIGRIMRLARPSVATVPYIRFVNRKQKKNVKKIKIGINVPQGTSKWSVDFQLKGKRWRSLVVKTSTAYLVYMFTYDRRLRRRLQTRLTIVRPILKHTIRFNQSISQS